MHGRGRKVCGDAFRQYEHDGQLRWRYLASSDRLHSAADSSQLVYHLLRVRSDLLYGYLLLDASRPCLTPRPTSQCRSAFRSSRASQLRLSVEWKKKFVALGLGTVLTLVFECRPFYLGEV